jgi:hypothetical protein
MPTVPRALGDQPCLVRQRGWTDSDVDITGCHARAASLCGPVPSQLLQEGWPLGHFANEVGGWELATTSSCSVATALGLLVLCLNGSERFGLSSGASCCLVPALLIPLPIGGYQTATLVARGRLNVSTLIRIELFLVQNL